MYHIIKGKGKELDEYYIDGNVFWISVDSTRSWMVVLGMKKEIECWEEEETSVFCS